MKTSHLVLSILFLFAPLTFAAAQEEPEKKEDVQWNRLQSADREFSIELPSNFVYFYDKEGFVISYPDRGTYRFAEMHQLSASAGKTVMRVEIYTPSSPKACLEELFRGDNVDGAKTKESRPGFTIRQVEQNQFPSLRTNTVATISHITKYIASKDHLYVVSVSSRGSQTAESTRFLSSIRLNKDAPPENSAEKVVSIAALKPITIDQIAFDGRDPGNAPLPAPSNPPVKPVKNPTAVLILTKPRPSFTDTARQNGRFSAVVSMRVTMAKDGNISKVLILSALPAGLSRNSFFAAMRLRFVPEEKDGKAVDVTKTIEYHFEIR